MNIDRKSKRIHWEIMIQLEEAGEEDICGLLNEVMGAQSDFGSGSDLLVFLDAIEYLRRQGEVQIRGYFLEGEKTTFCGISSGPIANLSAEFEFNSNSRFWEWTGGTRQMVELTDR